MRRRCSPGWGGWCGRRGLARCVGVFEDLADPCLEIVVVMDVTFIVGLELVEGVFVGVLALSMGGVGVTSWLTLAG